ncbi:MAG: hypothetical protein HYY30_07010 [Chloroflexi bacterium]|nr:hypothetical protein [Chloroflexota bacterium]
MPVEPIPPKADPETIRGCLLDPDATRYFFQRWKEDVCQPYTRLLDTLLVGGARFLVSISGPLLQMLAQDNSGVVIDFLRLMRHPSILPVCGDAGNSIALYLDIDLFRREMEKGRELASDVLGRTPEFVVAPHMSISKEIYHVCDQLGFTGIIIDGGWDLLKGRRAANVHRNGDGPFLLVRNSDLSLKIAASLSQPCKASYSVDTFPLAAKVIEYPEDFLLIGWQVGLFNGQKSHVDECAILEKSLCEIVQRDIGFPAIDRVLSRDKLFPFLHLPSTPAVSCEYGDIFFFLGHPVQQDVFCLMRQAFSISRLTRNEALEGLAVGMAQWDILALLHNLTVSDGNYSQPHYVAPANWDQLGVNGVLTHVRRLYEHFIQSVSESYL